jgi:hypothetical protein
MNFDIDNQISDQGAIAIAKGLKSNNSLSKLNLNCKTFRSIKSQKQIKLEI